MTLGYRLSGPDNDSYMLHGGDSAPRCPVCGFVLNHEWINEKFSLKKRQWDISFTYDAYCIVSTRFRDALGNDRGAIYRALPSEPLFFVLDANEAVAFDSHRRKTRFENFCEGCGRYRQVIGSTPVFLPTTEPLPDRLLRTDIEFGSDDALHPLLLVGPNLGADLASADLAGLELMAVES